MFKGIVLSRILARYSVFMAIRAAEQKFRAAARVGRVPIAAGIIAGAAIGWLISGLIGAVVGALAGLLLVDSYKQPEYVRRNQSRRHYA